MKSPEALRGFLCMLCHCLNFSEKMNTALMIYNISDLSLEENKI